VIPVFQHHISPEDERAVLDALRSDTLTRGAALARFEQQFAAYIGAPYCIAVSSGTMALELAYIAVGTRHIFTSPVSFIATAQAAWRLGLNVTFGDCDPLTGLLLPQHTTQGGLPVPVTLGGQPLPWPTVGAIYDACHGPYRWISGATAMCFSFHPGKHIAAGEGGAIVCDDPALASRLRMLRDAGRGVAVPKFWVQPGGTNGWMAEMPCALAASQLTRLTGNIAKRKAIADLYDKGFWHVCEVVEHHPDSARHLYQILVDDRSTTQRALLARGVSSQVHYWPIITNQPAAAQLGYQVGQFPGAEAFSQRALTLPLFPTMTTEQVATVIQAVQAVL